MVSELNIPPVHDSSFWLELAEDHPARFKFRGNADTSAVGPLEVFLRQVHSEMLSCMKREVEVDFSELYIMNSSCMKQFIAWIYKVSMEGRPYRIRFWQTPRLRWQERTLATFRRLAPDTVEIAAKYSLPPT